MLVPRQEYSRELKVACMRELDAGKGVAEVARQYQISPKRLENWKGECRAKGGLVFPGKGARPQSRLDSERMAVLERKIGQQTMEIDFLKKVLWRFKENPLGVDANGGVASTSKIQEAAEAEAGVNRLCLPGDRSEPRRILPFSTRS